jgi:hypothetical protein
MPSRNADDNELLGIGSALGVTGTGAFGMNSDFDDEEFELHWMRQLARETRRPVWFLLTVRYSDPKRSRRLMKAVYEARAHGLPLTAQVAGRPISVMMGIGTALNPFTVRPTYKELEGLPIEEQRRRLGDPEVRRQILTEKPSQAAVKKLPEFRQVVTERFDKFFEAQRRQMLAEISATTARVRGLIGKAALDERVMRAMGKVPRHEFVPIELQPYAYANRPLPIGFDKTISQPFIVALMTDLLEIGADNTVLEIGTPWLSDCNPRTAGQEDIQHRDY